MPKRIRETPLLIAPEIIAWKNENEYFVIDTKENIFLQPDNEFDKIHIYERQVFDWFLNPAKKLLKQKNKSFIVLMICASYLEGVQQYRRGQLSHNQSSRFFRDAIERIFPNELTNDEISRLYSQGRCGLFHNGMVRNEIVISDNFTNAFEITNDTIIINLEIFLNQIILDFKDFIELLKTDTEYRLRFSRMYSNL